MRVLDVLYISLEFIAWSLGHTKSSAAQVYLMRPVVLHSCLRGLKGISKLLCNQRPHKKNPVKSVSGNTDQSDTVN